MIALIDGDIIVYRVGFTTQNEPVGIACARVDTLLENILRRLDTQEYRVFLTSQDKSNFRFELYPEYKANRKQPKPTWYLEIREHLIHEHRAEVVAGREADDALADAQTDDTCICSIDKDLDQIPGKHYNFVKDNLYEVTREDGIQFFYQQLLQGDRTDNIPGVEGCGPVGARRILAGCRTEQEYFERVQAEYRRCYARNGDSLLKIYGGCLKIGGSIWDVPNGKPESTAPDSKQELDPSSNQMDLSTSHSS